MLYAPLMYATGNTYGPTKALHPFLTASSHAEIELILLSSLNETSP